MARSYNFIYNKLVESEDDIIGHVAYSLYKKEKQAFIQQWKEEHKGKEISETDISSFHKAASLSNACERYRLQAKDILQNFMNSVLVNTTRQIEEDYKNQQTENLKQIIMPLVPDKRAIQYFHGVAQSVIGAFVFALILAAVGFIAYFKSGDINISIGQKDKTETVQVPKVVNTNDSLSADIK